jgi:outer membrane protein insertion porin family
LTSIRVALLAASCLSIVVTDPAWAQQAVSPARGRPSARPVAARPTSGTIQAIKVEGNQRIEEGTIRSYMLVQPGDPFDPDRIDRSL